METRDVEIAAAGAQLRAIVSLPATPLGLVFFAHGSGSSRFSTRNQQVAAVLQGGGLATVLLDLLTPREAVIDERTREYRFDIELLARRLDGATTAAPALVRGALPPLGYFGASTGAAAALIAAAVRTDVRAVVSRGGRPDLAAGVLARVHAAVLLIVGGNDPEVLRLNQSAQRQLAGKSDLLVVPGATHLFEEPGTLGVAAQAACDWFLRHLAGGS
ncbi:hydrolase [bacterium]|nr:MAG: hydrolase [bacterium]